MARIIRTTPTNRKTPILRVIFSFLLFMQIQMPQANEVKTDEILDLSFYLAAREMPQISHADPETTPAPEPILLKTR